MKIEFVAVDTQADAKSALAVPAYEKADLSDAAKALDAASGGAITRAIKGGRFTGGLGQTLDLVAPHGVDAARLLLVGLGAADAVNAQTAELAAGHVLGQRRHHPFQRIAQVRQADAGDRADRHGRHGAQAGTGDVVERLAHRRPGIGQIASGDGEQTVPDAHGVDGGQVLG